MRRREELLSSRGQAVLLARSSGWGPGCFLLMLLYFLNPTDTQGRVENYPLQLLGKSQAVTFRELSSVGTTSSSPLDRGF